jgi:hypothetical protein
MASRIRRAAVLAALCLGLVAAGERRVQVEIFIYDYDDHLYDQADVTVIAHPSGEEFFRVTSGPNLHARFALPAGTETIDVVVYDWDHQRSNCFYGLVVNGQNHVGGQGFFLGLPNPCGP